MRKLPAGIDGNSKKPSASAKVLKSRVGEKTVTATMALSAGVTPSANRTRPESEPAAARTTVKSITCPSVSRTAVSMPPNWSAALVADTVTPPAPTSTNSVKLLAPVNRVWLVL